MISGHKKKAKKHEWEAHKNNLDLKKFWEHYLGKPKHLGLKLTTMAEIPLSYSQYKWFQGRNEYRQSVQGRPNDTACVCHQ